ncbi:hypothetical protein AB0I28_12110 [Phytomonospora sp. NPDC050363]|uniref:hypothetical protein n=1 Tax=Phytomonospora sp. NPDC050363 TaxID=3155642 RepID=UPI0033DD825D
MTISAKADLPAGLRALRHGDIVRELAGGTVGRRSDGLNVPARDERRWAVHRDRLEETARRFA